MKAAGIDYSMSNPAMSIWDGTDYWFYYMTNTKSKVRVAKHLSSEYIDNITSVSKDIMDEKIGSSIARFQYIAHYFITMLDKHDITRVFIEGYSLGSKGMVFSIAENTAILKHYLIETNRNVDIFPPTTIKKWATGKGNSNKEAMKNSYETSNTPAYLSPISHYKSSPYTDCVDAYWILQYGLDKYKEN